MATYRSLFNRFGPTCLLITIGVAAYACSDNGATLPSERTLRHAPAYAFSAATTGNGDVHPANSSDDDSTFVYSYPYPTLSVVTGSGSVSAWYSSNPNWDTLAGLPWGTITYQGLGGGSILWANLEYHFYGTYSNQAGRFTVYHPGPDTVVVQGDGYAVYKRGAPYYTSWCSVPGVHCFDYSGTYSLSVAPIAADMEFSPVQRFIYPGGPSYAEARIRTLPQPVDDHPEVTLNIVWSWAADTGSSQSLPGECQGNRYCYLFASSSGTLTASAIVNGVSKVKSVRFEKLSCVTGDTLLDDSRIRRGLKQAWDGSDADGPANNRKERFGGLFDVDALEGADKRAVDSLFAPFPGANACRTNAPTDVLTWPHLGPRVLWHTHPFRPQELLPDEPYCQTSQPQKGQRRLGYGPSGPDLDIMSGYIPMIIVDKRFVYVVKPDSSVTPYKRSDCDPAA